jgi:zinc transporter ZupT
MRSMRYWLPVVVAFALLLISRSMSPLLAYVMIVAAAALIFEVGSALLAGASRTGSMHDHRQ